MTGTFGLQIRMIFHLKYRTHILILVWAHQFNEAKEKGIEYFSTNLNFEEKNKFYNELLSYVPGLPEASKDLYLSCPGLALSTVLFDNVSLYIENFSGTPYSDEENTILKDLDRYSNKLTPVS